MKKFQLNIGCQTTLRESESQTEIFDPVDQPSDPERALELDYPIHSCYGHLELHHLISHLYAEKLNSINAEYEGYIDGVKSKHIHELDELRGKVVRESIEYEVEHKCHESLLSLLRRFDDACMERVHKMDSRMSRCLKRSLSCHDANLRLHASTLRRARQKVSDANSKYLDTMQKFGTRLPQLDMKCLLGLTHTVGTKPLSPELIKHIEYQIQRLEPLPTRTDHSELRKKEVLSKAIKLVSTVPICSA